MVGLGSHARLIGVERTAIDSVIDSFVLFEFILLFSVNKLGSLHVDSVRSVRAKVHLAIESFVCEEELNGFDEKMRQ